MKRDNTHYCSTLHFVAGAHVISDTMSVCICVCVFSMCYIVQLKSTIAFPTTRIQSHAGKSRPSMTFFACGVEAKLRLNHRPTTL